MNQERAQGSMPEQRKTPEALGPRDLLNLRIDTLLAYTPAAPTETTRKIIIDVYMATPPADKKTIRELRSRTFILEMVESTPDERHNSPYPAIRALLEEAASKDAKEQRDLLKQARFLIAERDIIRRMKRENASPQQTDVAIRIAGELIQPLKSKNAKNTGNYL